MPRNRIGVRLCRAATASAALAALATACSHPAHQSAAASTEAADVPGQATVRTGDVDLSITRAVAHLDAAGDGVLTMTVHNGGGVPEHLDMVGTPDAGRGVIEGGPGQGDGSLADAGILMRPGSTVAFGANGPTVRLTGVHGVTAAHTLPIALEFGVARLVRLSAVVTAG